MDAADRVRRNFWILVAATVLAVGILSFAMRMPASPLAETLITISGLAAVASLALAGRILVVTTRRGVAGASHWPARYRRHAG